MEKWIDAWAVFGATGNILLDTIAGSFHEGLAQLCINYGGDDGFVIETVKNYEAKGYTCRPIQIREKE